MFGARTTAQMQHDARIYAMRQQNQLLNMGYQNAALAQLGAAGLDYLRGHQNAYQPPKTMKQEIAEIEAYFLEYLKAPNRGLHNRSKKCLNQ